MKSDQHQQLPLLRVWESTIHELLDCTEQFPTRVRYSFVQRIDNQALELLEQLTLARYATDQDEVLALPQADQALNRLKVLLRLAYTRQYISHKRYEYLVQKLEESGRMLGGWIKSVPSRPSKSHQGS